MVHVDDGVGRGVCTPRWDQDAPGPILGPLRGIVEHKETAVTRKVHTFRVMADCMLCDNVYTSAFIRIPLPPPGCPDKTNDEWISLITKTHKDRVLHVCPECFYRVTTVAELDGL